VLTEFSESDELVFNHISVNESYLINIDTMINEGTMYEGVLILSDTTLFNTTLTTEGCDSITQTNISVIISGTEELSFSQSVLLFPNPAKDLLSLQWSGWEVSEVKLFDVSGQLINLETTPKDMLEIKVSEFSSGVYYVQFNGTFGQVTKRFVKL